MITEGLRVGRMFSASKLQSDSSAHHGPVSEVHMRIVVELPEPFRTIVVDANADVMNEFTGFRTTGFEKAIKGNAVGAIECLTPENMSEWMIRVQTYIHT